MAKMSNSDILKIIKKRESRLNNYLMNLLDECNNSVMTDIRSWLLNSQIQLEVARSEELEDLKKNLEFDGYLLTERDAQLLRDNFVFVGGPIKKVEPEEIGDDTFAVISDFCYSDMPIESVLRFCMKRYDWVYVIGSSTGPSRKNVVGKAYFDNLLKIKQMDSEVCSNFDYIVGELDYILYGIYIGDPECCKKIPVTDELKYLLNENKALMEWLGEQKIQSEHCIEGDTFAMAYGFYNRHFYDEGLTYSLKDVFKPDLDNGIGVRELKEVVSLKPDAVYYDRLSLPTDGRTTIITANAGYDKFFPFASFVNSEGYAVPVLRIDDNVVFDGYALNRFIDLHYYDDREAIFHNGIMDLVYAIGKGAFTREYSLGFTEGLSRETSLKIVDNIDNQYGFSYGDMSEVDKYMMYKKIFVFDTLMNCLIHNCGNCSDAAAAMYKGMLANDVNAISDDVQVRCLADALGFENIKQILCAYSCNDVYDYVELKSYASSRDGKKVFQKTPAEL